MLELILGGVRSGKSGYAQQLAELSGLAVTYIATATAQDPEMAARIERHKNDRPGSWGVIEEPIRLTNVLKQQAATERCLLVDCLTLWLTNLITHNDKDLFDTEKHQLLENISDLPGNIILVSNETNMGVVPVNDMSRRFCDEAGRLHQELAAISDRVTLMVAGLPHVLKGAQE